MAIPRASAFRNTLRGTVFRRATAQPRKQAWRQIARRHYATGHEQKSSELPWIIGSVAFTVPAAVWLLGQGPSGNSHHGEGHGEEHKEEEAEETKEEEPKEDESKDEDQSEEKSKDSKEEEAEETDDKPAEGSDGDSSDDEGDKNDTPPTSDDSGSDDDEYEKPGQNAPGQINYKKGSGKGPGEGGKASERKPTEKKGEKDAAGDRSGAKHPYIDDPEKSKKLGGKVTETARIHGTVDPKATGATGGVGSASGKDDEEGDDK